MIRFGAMHGHFGAKLFGAVEMPSLTRIRCDIQAFTSAVNGQIRYKASTRPLVADYDDENMLSHDSDHKRLTQTRMQRLSRIKPHALTPKSPLPNHVQVEEKPVPPSTVTFTGATVLPLTSRLHIVAPGEELPHPKWPVFRLMNEDGMFRNTDGEEAIPATLKKAPCNLEMARSFLKQTSTSQNNEINTSGLLHENPTPFDDTGNTNTLLRAHRHLIRLREMDTVFNDAQRQGRISFYMTCTGEEAIHIGAGSALDNGDHVFAQYREQGVLMWRGFTLEQFANQCFTNDLDLGKGRQMPIHYGSRALNYHTVSSPLGTQLPQAVGAAFRLKMQGTPNVAIAFFGDGCASTTDFHAALNFAATLSSPVIFFCRNNGYAISTPVTEQYHGDGIVGHAPGYGMAAIRVDGNDLFAVNAAVREAKRYALTHSAPVLVEGMTYRLGHHSTSDDSTQYRAKDEIQDFSCRMDPLTRINHFVKRLGYYNDDDLAQIKEEERRAVISAMKKAEARPKPSRETLFNDVYHDVPSHLEEQRKALETHLTRFPSRP